MRGTACSRGAGNSTSVRSFGWHYLSKRYLSNTASLVFYGITCLIRLIEFAALFATIEENLR